MKTILRIIMILLAASAVAGAIFFAVTNSSTALSADEGGEPPAMTSADGQSFEQMEGPGGGDREGGSITQGLSGVLATVMKLAGITLFVLLLQKVISLIANRRLMPARC
jgi:hypothetical protein